MSLAAPLFLLGLVALALPLWLHWQRVRNAREQPFSSAMLLEPQQPPLRSRRRWQYLALLAVRLLLLTALCLAFAQPIWQRSGAAHRAAALQVLVLDTSLSMGAEGHFERARAEARHLIGQLGPGQKALLVSAADTLAPVSSAGSEPTDNGAALRAALTALRPGVARLDYGTAMAGVDALLARQRGPIDVHFISDFQASGTPTRFVDLLPPASTERTVAVQLHPIDTSVEPNWAVTALARNGADIVVSVRGFHTPAATLQVALEVNGRQVGELSAPIAVSGEAQLRFRQPVLRIGDNRVIARLHNHDALAADNVRFAVIDNAPLQSVPLLTRAPQGRAAKYLATALAAAGEGYVAQAYSPDSFDARTLSRYRWVLVDDLGTLDDTLAEQLRAFVQSGGALFAALGQRAATLPRLPLLADVLEGSSGDSDSPLTVGQIDVGEPLLAGLRGWEDLDISHLLLLVPQPADRVLVGASNGAPLLLLERRLGRGRVLLYTSDLNGDWNDLPLQPLFVGLVAQAAQYLSGRGEIPAAQTVGATLALGRDGGPAGQLIDPSGRTVLSLADTSRALTVKFDQSGFYQIYTPAGKALVAVNPDPLESDLAPMPAIQLAQWRSALAALDAAAANAGSTRRSSLVALAPLLLVLLVLLVLAESLLGNHTLVKPAALAKRITQAQRS